MLFILILAAGQFTASLIVSDGCSDTTDTIHQFVDRGNQNWTIVEYYISCNATSKFPFAHEFIDAEQNLLSLYGQNEMLKQQAIDSKDWTDARLLDLFGKSLNETLEDVQNTHTHLYCETWFHSYSHVKNNSCIDFINLWYFVYLSQFVMFISLMCIKICNTCCYKRDTTFQSYKRWT
eukprot:UN29386